FKFNPLVAPYKVGVIALQRKPLELVALARSLFDTFLEEEIEASFEESSISVGKKYARFDEIGVPFVLTVDPGTLRGEGITLRERDSGTQVLLPFESEEETVRLIAKLVKGRTSWDEIASIGKIIERNDL